MAMRCELCDPWSYIADVITPKQMNSDLRQHHLYITFYILLQLKETNTDCCHSWKLHYLPTRNINNIQIYVCSALLMFFNKSLSSINFLYAANDGAVLILMPPFISVHCICVNIISSCGAVKTVKSKSKNIQIKLGHMVSTLN